MQRLLALWDDLRSSLWLTPSLFAAGAMAVAWGVLRIDRWAAGLDESIAGAFTGGAESARQILSTIAGSMITLIGVTFSITLAALTLAAGQYSPRILRNFMRDRFNQTVLGVFVGTFLYTVLVLREIRAGEAAYVPGLAMTGAIAAVVVSLGFLIFFIHRVAGSIQASSIIQSVARETRTSLERTYDREPGVAGPARIRIHPDPAPEGFAITADRDGYIERIDPGALGAAAERADVELTLLLGPGDFVARDVALAVASPAPDEPEALVEAVRGAVFTGRQRTIAQDPAYGFRQLVDIAVRALSPGINDPTTASNAVDHLGALLVSIADRDAPDPVLRDQSGRVRLRLVGADFADYLGLACAEVRRYAGADLQVTLRLVDALARTAAATGRPERRAAIAEEAAAIAAGARRGIAAEADRRRVDEALAMLAAAVGRDPAALALD